MARNGSGVMSVLNTFTPNTIISSTAVNQDFADAADEITNSLPRDGQAGMTGQFKADVGAEATPGIAFAVDPNTGIRRVGADHLSIVTGGSDRLEIDSAGNGFFHGVLSIAALAVTTASVAVTTAGISMITAANAAAQAALLGLNTTFMASMVGIVADFAGTSAPTGWLMCFGQAISRTTYATLFDRLSTTYGVGDGSTTFNLPDLRGRVVAGKDDMGGSSADRLTDQSGGLDGDALGDTGGSETHTLVEAEHAAHRHLVVVNVSSEATDAVTSSESIQITGQGASANARYSLVGDAQEPTRGRTGIAGEDAPHNNVQPTIILNKMIFTGVFA
jgi:microcystin-dependent protein